MVVYIVSLPCANFYVHSCCISGVLLICTCVFGYFQVHQVLKKIITSVFQKLFSSNNFFLALKSIYFHPRTSLNPPPLGFCVSGVAKLIIEKATPASLGITGVATMYVRVKFHLVQKVMQHWTEIHQLWTCLGPSDSEGVSECDFSAMRF